MARISRRLMAVQQPEDFLAHQSLVRQQHVIRHRHIATPHEISNEADDHISDVARDLQQDRDAAAARHLLLQRLAAAHKLSRAENDDWDEGDEFAGDRSAGECSRHNIHQHQGESWGAKLLDVLGTAIGVIAFLVYFTGLVLFAIGLTGEYAASSDNETSFGQANSSDPAAKCPSQVFKAAGMALLSLSVPLMFLVAIPYVFYLI